MVGSRYDNLVHDRSGSHAREEGEGGRLERLLPELIKRLVEGIDKFSEGKDMRQRVSELKLPKEVLALLLAQLEESKNGLYRALAKELRDFLEQTNFADELIAALTKLTFEIRTEVRFVPSQKPRQGVTPDIRAKVKVNRGGGGPEAARPHASGPEHTQKHEPVEPSPATSAVDDTEAQRAAAETSQEPASAPTQSPKEAGS
jgi:hypothetical protein